MNHKLIIGWLSVLLVFSGAMTAFFGWKMYQRRNAPPVTITPINETKAIPAREKDGILQEFSLTERSGEPVHSSELEGKVHVVSFFFASCPSVCRTQNNKVMELAQQFGPRGAVMVSITCDPKRDTPQRLREYAAMYNAHPEQWLFLTGDLLHIRRVGAEMYQVAVNEETHGTRLALIDREGKIRGHYDCQDPDEFRELKQELKKLLDAAPNADGESESRAA